MVGFGTGFTGRAGLGKKPLKLADMRTHIAQVKALLRGDVADIDGDLAQMLASDDWLPDRPIDVPVYMAGQGPKARALAKEIAVIGDVAGDSDAFFGGIVGRVNRVSRWGDCRQLTDPIDRRSPVKSRMRPVPIPEVLPFVEPLSKVNRFGISRRPEFLEIGALGALDLTVEVW